MRFFLETFYDGCLVTLSFGWKACVILGVLGLGITFPYVSVPIIICFLIFLLGVCPK